MVRPDKKAVESVMRILREECRSFREPVVSTMSREKDPFKVLISTIISLRTKDKTTLKVSEALYRVADTPKRIVGIGLRRLERLLYPCGFYKNKARTIRNICRVLIGKYNGKVPDDIHELLRIKGIGRKTATLTMILGFNNNNFICVDTHCHRFPNRLGWIKTKTPHETEEELYRLLPRKYWQEFNDLVVAYGQNICLPVSPLCSKCRIRPYCKRINVKNSR